TEQDGFLHGRGSADMKGSLAAMITATERFLASSPVLNGRLCFLITSDEEGRAVHGIRKVVEVFQERGEVIDYCLVGEPSCSDKLGDTLRIGRRGSLSGTLTVKGVGGHIAYWQRADNPIHKALPALHKLTTEQWDSGESAFPPTSFQISNVHAGVGANNVIPETMMVEFNLRYSTELIAEEIQRRVESILSAEGVEFDLDWHLSGEPFLTEEPELIDQMQAAIQAVTGMNPENSTGGGTSDGRFIAKLGTQVVEFGPCNGTIHKPNECVSMADLEQLSEVYERVLHGMLTTD
ncbi:MAG: succinyl-diaminopimelate desuccinylase, partial [Pseudomonadales bacterium]|nr:succinyl-diaminopimelate desuccinylase [Pseudomonadales bacterium]